MKRPERKKVDGLKPIKEMAIGWNKCCDEWEEFLPDLEEIEKMLVHFEADILREDQYVNFVTSQKIRLAERIHKRLKGEE